MIITELKGRLGNQMFQYATGYAVAKRSNVPLRIDSLRFIEYNHRAPQLYCLPISAQEASPDERSCVASEGVELSENGLAFDPRLMERWHHAYLRGWWQSENYFSEFRQDILSSQFIPMDWIKNPADADIAKQMHDNISIAVHIRRGDYVTNPSTTEFHGVLPERYYQAANARILEDISRKRTAGRRMTLSISSFQTTSNGRAAICNFSIPGCWSVITASNAVISTCI
jgi:hypothetical protein